MIFSITLSGILSNALLTPNIPDILADLSQPESMAGRLVAVGPLPGIVGAPVIGVLADRYGRRQILVPCLVLFGVAGMASAVAQTFNQMLLARFFQGMGGAGLINLSVVLIGDHWQGAERTKLIGRNSAVITGTLAVMPLISGLIAEFVSWRASLALSAFSLPVAFVAYRVLPGKPAAEPRTLASQLRGAAKAIRTPTIQLVTAGAFLLFFVIFGVFLTTLPVHLEEQFGLGPGSRGLVLGSSALGAFIAAFNLGRLRRILSVRWVLVLSCCLISVAAAGVGLAPAIPLVVAAAIIYGLGEGASVSVLQVVAVSAAPDEQRASVMAIWVSAARIGQTTGPLAAAAVFAATSTTTAMVLGAAVFAAAAVMFMIGPLETTPAEAG
jgi:ACDE family multidrug resistance protein